jgi:predicted ATP-dependent endonuclease of OLD family
MAINRIEVKDFLAFRDKFACDFCKGANIIIGSNSTGKTTLLKVLYFSKTAQYLNSKMKKSGSKQITFSNEDTQLLIKQKDFILGWKDTNYRYDNSPITGYVFIPEKDILEHAKGLLKFIKDKQTGFSQIYEDYLVNAQDVPLQEQTALQQKIGTMISDTIGGDVHWDNGEGAFYTLRHDGTRIPFANEASGYKKLGFLGLLVTSGQLEKGSVLLWDEPENSLNPKLMPVLVDILLELTRNGTQIFLATHSEILASYFNVLRKNDDSVMFYSLYEDGGQIKADSSNRFDLLTPNNLTAEQVKLYKKEIEKDLDNG